MGTPGGLLTKLRHWEVLTGGRSSAASKDWGVLYVLRSARVLSFRGVSQRVFHVTRPTTVECWEGALVALRAFCGFGFIVVGCFTGDCRFGHTLSLLGLRIAKFSAPPSGRVLTAADGIDVSGQKVACAILLRLASL